MRVVFSSHFTVIKRLIRRKWLLFKPYLLCALYILFLPTCISLNSSFLYILYQHPPYVIVIDFNNFTEE